MIRVPLVLSLVTALSAATSGAWASGFSAARFGGEHGTPVSANPTAVFYNPAALTGSEGLNLLADAVIFIRDASYTHTQHPTDVPEPAGLEGANTGRATLLNLAVVPSLAASYAVGDFDVGLGYFIPFGGGTMWDDAERFAGNVAYPGAVGGPQRWHALDGTMQLMYWTAAVAYEIPDTGLSLGASGSLILSQIVALNARTVRGDNDMGSEGRSLLDVSTLAGGFAVGALLEAVEEVFWLGASYTSRPNVTGGHTLEGTLKNNFGTVDEAAVELHQDVPDVIRFGVRYRPAPAIELRLHGDWTRWSAFDDQCVSLAGDRCEVDEEGRAQGEPAPLQNIRRDWQDAVAIRVGVSYSPSPRWELMAGLGYDGNAIPDETLEPSLVDYEDFATTLGARVQLVEGHLSFELAYTQFYNIPRSNAGLSGLATQEESFNRVPDAGGHYTEVAGMVNSTVEASF